MWSVRFVSFSRNWMFGGSFCGRLRFGSVRRDDRFVSFRFALIKHIFRFVSFRFRFTDGLTSVSSLEEKNTMLETSLRFRRIGKDSRFESL